MTTLRTLTKATVYALFVLGFPIALYLLGGK